MILRTVGTGNVWPKSKGFKATSSNYAYTDLHHLRPTDSSINSSKDDKEFDDGDQPHDEAIGTFSDKDSWEPRDEIKGDVARMMFYMVVRHERVYEIQKNRNPFIDHPEWVEYIWDFK